MQLKLIQAIEEFTSLITTIFLLFGHEAHKLSKEDVVVKQEPSQKLATVALRALAHFYTRMENVVDDDV